MPTFPITTSQCSHSYPPLLQEMACAPLLPSASYFKDKSSMMGRSDPVIARPWSSSAVSPPLNDQITISRTFTSNQLQGSPSKHCQSTPFDRCKLSFNPTCSFPPPQPLQLLTPYSYTPRTRPVLPTHTVNYACALASEWPIFPFANTSDATGQQARAHAASGQCRLHFSCCPLTLVIHATAVAPSSPPLLGRPKGPRHIATTTSRTPAAPVSEFATDITTVTHASTPDLPHASPVHDVLLPPVHSHPISVSLPSPQSHPSPAPPPTPTVYEVQQPPAQRRPSSVSRIPAQNRPSPVSPSPLPESAFHSSHCKTIASPLSAHLNPCSRPRHRCLRRRHRHCRPCQRRLRQRRPRQICHRHRYRRRRHPCLRLMNSRHLCLCPTQSFIGNMPDAFRLPSEEYPSRSPYPNPHKTHYRNGRSTTDKPR